MAQTLGYPGTPLADSASKTRREGSESGLSRPLFSAGGKAGLCFTQQCQHQGESQGVLGVPKDLCEPRDSGGPLTWPGPSAPN